MCRAQRATELQSLFLLICFCSWLLAYSCPALAQHGLHHFLSASSSCCYTLCSPTKHAYKPNHAHQRKPAPPSPLCLALGRYNLGVKMASKCKFMISQKPLICDFCGSDHFIMQDSDINKNSLLDNLFKKSPNMFICTECGKTFFFTNAKLERVFL